jgi:hypothetical protein
VWAIGPPRRHSTASNGIATGDTTPLQHIGLYDAVMAVVDQRAEIIETRDVLPTRQWHERQHGEFRPFRGRTVRRNRLLDESKTERS